MSRVRDDVLRRVGQLPHDDAEDCFHDVMVRVAARVDVDLDRERLIPFLVRATRWRAVDRRRARDAAERRCSRSGATALVDFESPEDVVAGHELATSLRSAVRGLSPREREVIGHRVAGFDAGETARRLGISYKAQESALTRARTKLLTVVSSYAAAAVGLLRRRSAAHARAGATAAVIAAVLIAAPGSPRGVHAAGSAPRHARAGTAGADPRLVAQVRASGPSAASGLASLTRAAPAVSTPSLPSSATSSPLVPNVVIRAPVPPPARLHSLVPNPRRVASYVVDGRLLSPGDACSTSFEGEPPPAP